MCLCVQYVFVYAYLCVYVFMYVYSLKLDISKHLCMLHACMCTIVNCMNVWFLLNSV